MLFRSILLPGVIGPTVGAAIVVGLWAAAGGSGRLKGVGGGQAVAAAFLVAFVGLTGWPRWPPVEATQRLFFLVGLAGLMTVVAAVLGRTLARPLRWAFGLAMVGLLTQPLREHSWSSGESATWVIGLCLVFVLVEAAVAAGTTDADEEGGTLVRALVLLALLGGTTLVLGLSGSARLAQLLGAVACGAAVAETAARLRGRAAWSGSDLPIVALVVSGLILCGYLYASLAAWPAVLGVAAFALVGLTTRGGLAWRLVPLVPLVIAVTLVVVAFLGREEDPYGNYYGSIAPAAAAPQLDGLRG